MVDKNVGTLIKSKTVSVRGIPQTEYGKEALKILKGLIQDMNTASDKHAVRQKAKEAWDKNLEYTENTMNKDVLFILSVNAALTDIIGF